MSLPESNKAVSPSVRSIAGLVVCLVLGTPLLCRAQDVPPQASPPVSEAKPVEGISDGKPVSADLVLLAKAMQSLASTSAFFYEGDIEIKGVGKGLDFTGRERVRFTAKRPGKIRSDVMISLGDAPSGKHYITVADGAQIWVQRPGTRQYSVSRFNVADLIKDLNGLGILGALFCNRDLLNGIGEIAKVPPEESAQLAEQLVELLKKENIDLSGTTETVDGEEMPVYTLVLRKTLPIAVSKKEGDATVTRPSTEQVTRTYRFFVDPKQAVMRRLEVHALDKGMNLTMTETVVRQNATPILTKGEFKFVPPPGHTKTERITVDML